MKRILLSCLLILFIYTLKAQDTHLNDVVNTLKERISLAGYAQVGYTYDDAGEKASNTFDIKRVIYGISVPAPTHCPHRTVQNDVYYRKSYVSLFCRTDKCYSQAVNYLAGINGSDPLYGSNSGRDMGILIYGDLFKKKLSYNFAVMNGQGINLKDKNNQKDIVGSLMVHPLDWLSVGGSFIKGKGCAVAASSINPDIAAGDSYTRNRWSAGATIQTKPVSLRTEYLAGKDGHIKSDGYYATASIHVLPKFDIVASYDYFNKDKAQDYKQNNYVAGVQWWFYPKCRLQAQYTYCDPHKGDSSNLLQAQLQVRF